MTGPEISKLSQKYFKLEDAPEIDTNRKDDTDFSRKASETQMAKEVLAELDLKGKAIDDTNVREDAAPVLERKKAKAKAEAVNTKTKLTALCKQLQEVDQGNDDDDSVKIETTLKEIKRLMNVGTLLEVFEKSKEIFKIAGVDPQKLGLLTRLSESDRKALEFDSLKVGDLNRSHEEIEASAQTLGERLDDPIYPNLDTKNCPEAELELIQVITAFVNIARYQQLNSEVLAIVCKKEETAFDHDLAELRNMVGLRGFENKRLEILAKLESAKLYSRALDTFADPQQTDPVRLKEAALNLSNSTPLSQAQYDRVNEKLEKIVVEDAYCADVERLIPDKLRIVKSDLGDYQDVARLVARRAHESGSDPKLLMQSLLNGASTFALPNMKKEALEKMRLDLMLQVLRFDLDSEVADAIAKLPDPNNERARTLKAGEVRGQLLQWVDLLFQTGYPEMSEEAVVVKQALLPKQYAEDISYQHAAMLAHRRLMGFLQQGILNEDDKKKGTLASSKDQLHMLGGVASISSYGFLLTHELVDALKKGTKTGVKLPVDELNYQIADLAMLQFELVRRGLIALPYQEKAGKEVKVKRENFVNGFLLVENKFGSVEYDEKKFTDQQKVQAEGWVLGEKQGAGVNAEAVEVANDVGEVESYKLPLTDLLPKQKVIEDLLNKERPLNKEDAQRLNQYLNLSISEQIKAEINVLKANPDVAGNADKLAVLENLPVHEVLEAELKRLKLLPETEARNTLISGVENMLRQQYAAIKDSAGYAKTQIEGLGSYKEWCQSLGLTGPAVDQADAAYAMRRRIHPADLLDRAQQLYKKGLSSAGVEKVVTDKLKDADALREARRKIREKSGDLPVSIALNKRLADLSGLVKASDRMQDPQDGMQINLQNVKAAMKEQTGKLLHRIWSRDKYKAFVNQMNQQVVVLQREAQLHNRLESNVQAIVDFESKNNEEEAAKQKLSDVTARKTAMSEARKSIKRRSWYNRFGFFRLNRWIRSKGKAAIAERLEVSATVLTQYQDLARLLDNLKNDKKARDNNQPVLVQDDAEREHMISTTETKLAGIRQRLAGVDPRKMVHVEGVGVPTHEEVMGLMLPRAQAYEYFHKVDDQGITQAQRDADTLSQTTKKLKTLREERRKLENPLRAAVGKEAKEQLRDILLAAILLAVAESGEPVKSLRMTDSKMRDAILKNLKDWGLDVEECGPLVRDLLMAGMNKYVHSDGRLRLSVVRKTARSDKMHFAAGKDAQRDLKAEGGNIANELAPKEAIYREGAASIMKRVAKSGTSFAYSRTRGYAYDLGSVYMPWAGLTQNSLFFNTVANTTKWNWGFTAGANLKHEEGFVITKKGENSYEVVVKGNWVAGGNITPTMAKFGSFGSMALKLSAQFNKASGVVVNFSDKESCEKFVELLMKPKAPNSEALEEAMFNSSQIRTLSEYGYGADATLNLVFWGNWDPTTWHPADDKNKTSLNLRPGMTVQLSAGLGQKNSVKENAKGSVLTVHTDIKASVGMNVRAEFATSRKDFQEVLNNDNQDWNDFLNLVGRDGKEAEEIVKDNLTENVGGKIQQPLASGNFIDYSLSTDFSIVTDETGISKDCSMTTSMTAESKMSWSKLSDKLWKKFKLSKALQKSHRWVISDAQMEKLKAQDPDVEKKIANMMDNLKPNEKLSVVQKISGEALAKIRQRLATVRSNVGSGKNLGKAYEENEKLMKEVRDILGNQDNYVPTEIKITGTGSEDLSWSSSWSPGLLIFGQVIREGKFTYTRTREGVSVKLPEVA